MQRYFIPENQWQLPNDRLIIKNDDYHHIVNVMRMQIDDEFICCDPSEQSYLVKIVEIVDSDKTIHGEIVKPLDEQNELPVNVTIAYGLPKGDKLDLVVQKGTELGMRELIPLKMDRSVVKWDEKKADKKIQRLQKIAKEAGEQSHRQTVPSIGSLQNLRSLLQDRTFDQIMVASEYEAKSLENKDNSFAHTIEHFNEGDDVLVIVGPEGGISEAELQLCQEEDVTPIRLGPRILRSETAPLYILSALSFYLEEWR
ncbi:16S rRNA (uracil(1498)-N(3))-methyltransferase [Alkalibacillus silvisoli]|uniref:Ribosomal RNA small subunit methyltransferase E n=1 Tax=Alkalibacillus silvisoli TaxID=392823 RepID=A0ABP3JLC3_9BACI